jgi:hypothetical protein
MVMGVQQNQGLYCATNIETNYNFVETTTSSVYVMSTAQYSSNIPTFTRNFDATTGTTSVDMKYAEINPGQESFWCASDSSMLSWQPVGVNDVCYGVPVSSLKMTYCTYATSLCSIDGECYLDNLSNSIYLYNVIPFFSGVITQSDLEYTFIL